MINELKFIELINNMTGSCITLELFALLNIIFLFSMIRISNSASINDLHDARSIQRLRNMLDRSRALAINNFYEQQALKMMVSSNVTHQQPTILFVPITSDDSSQSSNKDGESRNEYLIMSHLGRDETGHEAIDNEELITRNSNGTHTSNAKSDARQSSLFGGLPSSGFGNGFGSSNPLMNNLFKPPTFPTLPPLTFPTLAPFRPFGQQTTRQPKTAIIGNGGGAMALTNDNVVVVNVLSGNY